jgi:Sigma-70 region 2
MPFSLHMDVRRTTVMPMHDREMVAAIVGGDPGGIAAAYDAYAMPLYSYCRTLLREPADAADAVQDTFLVATVRLGGLRDPDKLRSWLYAVARNECYRRLRAAGGPDPGPRDIVELSLVQGLDGDELADVLRVARPHAAALLARARGLLDRPSAALPLVALVPGFREHVLTVCADVTPAGLARRAGVAARAGPFGPAGFPEPSSPSRVSGWRRLTRHPRTAAAVAAAAVAAAGIGAVLVMGGGNPSSHAAAAVAGARGSAEPGVAAGSRGAPARDPGSPPGAGGSALAPSARLGGTSAPGLVTSGTSHPAPGPSGTATATPRSSSGSTSPDPGSSSAAPSASAASSSPPAAQGTLTVSPSRVVLAAVSGHGTGTFTLTAQGGPVSYTISGPSGLSVSPASGSLASGASVTITVTSATLVTLNDQLTINPGGHAVTVVLNISV